MIKPNESNKILHKFSKHKMLKQHEMTSKVLLLFSKFFLFLK